MSNLTVIQCQETAPAPRLLLMVCPVGRLTWFYLVIPIAMLFCVR